MVEPLRLRLSLSDDDDYILRVRATDPSGAYANVNVTVTLKETRNEAPTFEEADDDPRTAVTVVEGTTSPCCNPLPMTKRVTTEVLPWAGLPSWLRIRIRLVTLLRPLSATPVEGADAKYFNISNDVVSCYRTFGCTVA